MGSPMKAESVALLRMLRDGEWRDYEATVKELTGMVAPGRALRQWYASRKVEGRVGPEPTEDEKVVGGARSMAIATINSMRKRYIELEFDDEGRRTRMRRRAETLPVNRPQRPAQPSEKASEVPSAAAEEPEPAFEPIVAHSVAWIDEDTLRDIIRNEMGRVIGPFLRRVCREELGDMLDVFQVNLQGFLLDKFAGLEILTVQSQRRGPPWKQGQQPGQGRPQQQGPPKPQPPQRRT